MIFGSILRNINSLSSDQVSRILCGLRVPKHAIIKKQASVLQGMATLFFRSFLYNIKIHKNVKEKQMISLFKQLRGIRGLHHLFHLPVNGQRSHTNARTQKKKSKHKK